MRSTSLLVPLTVTRSAWERSPTRIVVSGARETKYSDAKNDNGNWCRSRKRASTRSQSTISKRIMSLTHSTRLAGLAIMGSVLCLRLVSG